MENYDICIISVPEDAGTAETLAASIRSYHLPKGVVPAQPEWDYRSIYVDSTGTSFDRTTRELLDHSRYLVIICSPRTKNDRAILERCIYFKKIRQDEDIVAVIADGEPADSFPEFLIEKRLVRHIMPDMRIIEREETIEPVASDLRGQTPAQRQHALRYETVRITASVLGLHPDDLEQRHRKRRKRAILAVASVVCAVCVAAAGIFLRFGLIARNEGRIAEQQTELSTEAAERLIKELPEQFSDDPQALAYIEDAIAEAQDALNRAAALEESEG